MQIFLILVAAFVVLAVTWAFLYDRRHRGESLTGSKPQRTSKKASDQGGAKGRGGRHRRIGAYLACPATATSAHGALRAVIHLCRPAVVV